MKNGIPVAYSTFRVVWTFFHLGLVATALILFIVAFVHDGDGPRAIAGIWSGLLAAQSAVAGAIPFPWGG